MKVESRMVGTSAEGEKGREVDQRSAKLYLVGIRSSFVLLHSIMTMDNDNTQCISIIYGKRF